MIAIVVGFVGLFSINEIFFKIIYGNTFIFLGAFVLALYDFLRIKYWTYFSSTGILLTKDQAIELFNDYNSKVNGLCLEEVASSYTCILQTAIKCQLWNIANDKNGYWLSRQMLTSVLRTGPGSLIPKNHEGNNLKSE